MELKKIRLSKGKSQQQVADAIGVSQRTFSSYERKSTFPTEQTLLKLADYFDISIDMLLGRPRPYDLPSGTTEIQKRLIKQVLKLDDDVCEIVEAQLNAVVDAVEKKKILISKFKN